MKLRVQELKWQSGNQLFQVQKYDKEDDCWLAVGYGPHHTLEEAIAAANAMLIPVERSLVQETIHEIE